jgi:type II secretory pathway pseudopilin PulG
MKNSRNKNDKPKKNCGSNDKLGFTLVEMLLYTMVLGICLTAMAGFIDMINGVKAKNQIILRVERQGENINSLIRENIVAASNVNAPSRGTSSSTLSLAFNDATRNPTIFSLNENSITIKAGTSSVVELNDPYVTAENLVFYNYGQTNAPGNISSSFSLKVGTSTDRAEFSYKKNFKLNVSRHY